MLATPIEVKKAYKEGTHKKNYRFVVLNDDGTEDFTIDNDTLVAESVHIDERMATGSELKFGLCEGSSLEFQYFDHPNINGRRLQAFIDIDYGAAEPHATPMGFFTVKECPRQFSTGIYKATAYNKLQSDYLDAKANDLIISIVEEGEPGYTDMACVQTILDKLLGDYAINVKPITTHESNHFGGGYVDVRSYTQLYQSGDHSYGSGYYLNEYMYEAYFSMRDIITSSTDYYRVIVKAKALADKFNDICAPFRLDENDNPYLYFDGYLPIGEETNTRYTFDQLMQHYNSDFALRVYTDGTQSGLIINVPLYRSAETEITTEWFSGITSWIHAVGINIPIYLLLDVNYVTSVTPEMPPLLMALYNALMAEIPNCITVEHRTLSDIEKTKYTLADVESWGDITLRELQSAVYETQCQYGQLDRITDLFYGVELNGGGLYPAEPLYPADSLYPNNGTGGQGIHPYPSEYSQLWTDTMGEQSFRYLIITYKTLDENNQEVDAVLQRTVNADGTTDYNMSDNWLFRNLVWTAADVGDYADAMVTKMQDIRWFPFEMWAAGLPYVETGDAIEITDRDGNTHNSYILQRQLQGIQNLQDTYVNGELDIF